MISINYNNASGSFFTEPFQLGAMHLKLAFCKGTTDSINSLIISGVINGNVTQPTTITKRQRVFHALVGLGETLGYVTIVVPFIIAAVDKHFNKPRTNDLANVRAFKNKFNDAILKLQRATDQQFANNEARLAELLGDKSKKT